MTSNEILEEISRLFDTFDKNQDGDRTLKSEISIEDEYLKERASRLNSNLFKINGKHSRKIEYAYDALITIEDIVHHKDEENIEDLEWFLQDSHIDEYLVPDINTMHRLEWVQEDFDHLHYTEEAIDELGWSGVGESITNAIGWGQYRMKQRVTFAVTEVIESFLV